MRIATSQTAWLLEEIARKNLTVDQAIKLAEKVLRPKKAAEHPAPQNLEGEKWP